VLDSVPDDGFLPPASTGRPGHGPRVLFRAYLTRFVLNTSSISAALRLISADPQLSAIVGGAPSKQAVSRYIIRLRDCPGLLSRCMKLLAHNLHEFLPDLGEYIALDSTDIKAWARRTKHRVPANRDAGTSVKTGTDGRLKFWYGYKTHLVCDPRYEIPLAAYVTPANHSDQQQVEPSLALVSRFKPVFVMADAGYDSRANHQIVEDYGAIPVIKRNKRRGAVQEPTKEWKELYMVRTGIERCFSRLKDFRGLNRLTLRGLAKATIHCLCAVLVLMAGALAAILLGYPEAMRCVA